MKGENMFSNPKFKRAKTKYYKKRKTLQTKHVQNNSFITYPHFRKLNIYEGPAGNKQKHPKIIIERENDKYSYMGLTESPKRGHHSNLPLNKNPRRGDSRPAYVRKEVLLRSVYDFDEILSNYSLSNIDRLNVLNEYNKLKKKK